MLRYWGCGAGAFANAAIKPTADVGVVAGVVVAEITVARTTKVPQGRVLPAIKTVPQGPVCPAAIRPFPRALGALFTHRVLSAVSAFIALSFLILNAAQAQQIKASIHSATAYNYGAADEGADQADAGTEMDELVLGRSDLAGRNDLGRNANATKSQHLPAGWRAKQLRDQDISRPSFLVTMINNLFPGIIPTKSLELNRDQSPVATRESWTGAALDQYGWSIYSGLTWAPFAHEGVGGEGWRIRLTGGRSRYNYSNSIWNETNKAAETVSYHGQSSWSDLLIGYKKQIGSVTVKGFIGATRGVNAVAPYDLDAKTLGAYFGVKGALETWINLSPTFWLSMDISYAKPHHSYSLNSRLGYRWTRAWSLGGEIAQYGNDDGSGRRLGGFARYEWDAGEISASAGLTGDLWWTPAPTSHRRAVAYGSVNVLRRF